MTTRGTKLKYRVAANSIANVYPRRCNEGAIRRWLRGLSRHRRSPCAAQATRPAFVGVAANVDAMRERYPYGRKVEPSAERQGFSSRLRQTELMQ